MSADLSSAVRASVAALNAQVRTLETEIQAAEQTLAGLVEMRERSFSALDLLGEPSTNSTDDDKFFEVEVWLRERAEHLGLYERGFSRTDLIRDLDFHVVPEKEAMKMMEAMESRGVLVFERRGKGNSRYYTLAQ